MANFKNAAIEQDFMFVDEDGNPIEASGENLIYVDESGREISSDRAAHLLESGEYIDTRVLYEDKSKKKAFNNMAGEARVRDQIRDEIVAKAYQMSLIRDPNAAARNRAEEHAFLKINKPNDNNHLPPLTPLRPHNQPPPPHQQQQQQRQSTPLHQQQRQQQQRFDDQQQQQARHRAAAAAEEQARHRAEEQARHRAEEQARIKAHSQNRARIEQQNQQLQQQQRNRSYSTDQARQQMRSRNATPIAPRLERSNSRGNNVRGKENLTQQQNKLNTSRSSVGGGGGGGEQNKSKEEQMLSLLKNQLLKKQQELMHPSHDNVTNNNNKNNKQPHQPLRRDNSKILSNKNTSYY